MQNHFQSWQKDTNIASFDITLMSLLQYLYTFLSILILEAPEVAARKSSMKKVFLKIPQNFQENICAEVSFTVKLQAGGPQLHEMQNLVQVLSSEFCEIFKNIYFANVCEGLPLKSKIFTGVSFRKILGFYYKRNRQLFHYEGTSSFIPLKTRELVNTVSFRNSSELLLKIPQ